MARRFSPVLRAARIAGWVILAPLLAVTVVLTATILYARTDAGRERVRRLVLTEARRQLPGLDVRRIDGDYVHNLTLRDVDVRDQQGRVAVHIDSVAAGFDLLALRHHTAAVSDLRIEGARLLVRPTETGALNIASLVKPPVAEPATATPAAPPQASRWRVHIERLQVVDLGADVELGDGTRAAIPTLDLEARLTLDGDRLAATVRQLEVSGDRAGHLFLDGRATVANVGVGPPQLGAYQAFLSAQNLDPARLFSRAPPGRLVATVSVSGTGPPLGAGSDSKLELRVAPSEIAGSAVSSGTVRARADGPAWRIEQVDLAAPGIAATLRGRGHDRWVALDLAATLKTPLAALAVRKPPPIHGRGTLSAHVEGTLPDVNVTLNARLSGLRAGGARVADAVFRARVHNPLSAPAGDVRVSARGIVLASDAPRVDRLTLTATGDRRSLRVSANAVGPRVRGDLLARGTLAPGAVNARLQTLTLDFTTRRYRQMLALLRPAQVRVRAADGVTWNDLALRGTGFRFTGEAITSGALRPQAGRRASVAQLRLTLRNASFNGVPAVDANLSATLLRDRATATLDASMPADRAQVHLDADLPVLVPRGGSPRLAASGPLVVNVRASNLRLESVLALQDVLRRQGVSGGVAALNLAVTGDVAHPDAHAAFDLRDVMYRNIRGIGRDATIKTVAGLGGSVNLDSEPGAVSATLVLRIRDAGVLTAAARVPIDLRRLMTGVDPRALPVQATLTIPTFALQSLSEFTDDMKGVTGQLSGQATLDGTLGSPSGTAQLRITDARVDDLRFGIVDLSGQARAGRIQARLVVPQVSGGSLTASATLDRRDGDRLQATVDARALDLRFVRLLAPTLRETGGVAFLSASASGRLPRPIVNADLRVQRGRVGIIGQPTFHDVNLAASLRPGRAELTMLEARSGDGALSGSGWVILDGLQPKQAVFKAHAHRFLVAAAGSTGAIVDGDVAAQAVLRQDVLAGKVDVPRAQVWLPKGPTAGGSRRLQKIGPHGDVRFVDDAAQAAAQRERDNAAVAPRALDLGVRAGPVYVRGKDLDLELDSALQVGTATSGPRAGAPTVSGAIHIRRGRINIQGQRFDVTRGEITFDGSPDLTPHFDVRLERQYPDARVTLGLRGTPQKPELELTSEPPLYDRAQIVSLILTGQPGGQPSDGRSFDAASAVATAVLSQLADTIAPEIGLDVLRVESGSAAAEKGAGAMADTRVEIGKYVSDRIYLSYAHIFAAPETANQNEAHVEYRLTRRWMVETIFGDAGVGGVDALWTVRY